MINFSCSSCVFHRPIIIMQHMIRRIVLFVREICNGFGCVQEVCIRYVGFGADEDEWVNVKKDVRERSVPFDHSECQNVKVGDLVVCFQVLFYIYISILSTLLCRLGV